MSTTRELLMFHILENLKFAIYAQLHIAMYD